MEWDKERIQVWLNFFAQLEAGVAIDYNEEIQDFGFGHVMFETRYCLLDIQVE